MVKSKVIDIDGIGKVLFERSRRSRHINITIKPFRGVRVAIPAAVSFKAAEKFIHDKKDWVKRHVLKMRQYESEMKTVPEGSRDIDRAVAKRVLTGRLEQLAKKHGFTCNRVTIKNQRTRWGSCSYNNNVSLNMKLLNLPDELIDYVLLHELVHTRVHNHSRDFWQELDRYVGNPRSLASQLRKYEGYLRLIDLNDS